MTKALVTYTTQSGSTAEVAQTIADTLRQADWQVDLLPLEQVSFVQGYDLVVIGAPMILGWSRSAVQFIKRHQQELVGTRTAYFCTLMRLTQIGETSLSGVPVCLDPWVAKPPRNPARLGIKESYATLSNYLRPVLKGAPKVRPCSIAFFGGRLELFRLKWWQALFVMVIIQARPGDLRNWDFIKSWAAGLAA